MINMRIGQIASSAEYRMDKQFQNLKNSENLLIFQVIKFWKFVNFPIWIIPKTSYLGNS